MLHFWGRGCERALCAFEATLGIATGEVDRVACGVFDGVSEGYEDGAAAGTAISRSSRLGAPGSLMAVPP
jgi:hypothetical protein